MKPLLLLLTLGSLAAFAETFTVIGTIDSLAGGEINVKTGRGAQKIFAGNRTEVWKGKLYRDLSPLKPGQEISVRAEPNASGKLVAVKIWAAVVTFSATVHSVSPDRIEVVTKLTADSPREEHRLVNLYPDTLFATDRANLTVGEHVRVVGLDVGNGAVDAARITIYNTDIPVDAQQK